MLLRRITDHVKEQNWTAVGLDLLIVVFGVFIGIQVANWNGARIDAQREQQVLRELLDDLRQDTLQLSAASQAARLSIDAANILLEKADLEPITQVSFPIANPQTNTDLVVAPPDALDDDQATAFWTYITTRYYPAQNDSALNALTATGSFAIVKDREIVRDLQRYKTYWINVMASHNNTYRPFRNHLVFVGQKHGLSPFTALDLDALVQIVSIDPEMQGAIRTIAEYAVFHRETLEGLHDEAQTLIDRIEAASAS
ncbi:MAG: hypothetical protein AAFY83_08525 [Pseudomonadota bacterium]